MLRGLSGAFSTCFKKEENRVKKTVHLSLKFSTSRARILSALKYDINSAINLADNDLAIT